MESSLDVNAVLLVIAAIAGIATALGSPILSIIEALKATPLVQPGWAGVWAILVGMLFGFLIGLLIRIESGDRQWLLACTIGGLLAGANAVTQHLKTSAAIANANTRQMYATPNNYDNTPMTAENKTWYDAIPADDDLNYDGHSGEDADPGDTVPEPTPVKTDPETTDPANEHVSTTVVAAA